MMNKQEAIEKIERRKRYFSTDDNYDRGYRHGLESSKFILRELDEPEKPIIPQFVADWYEENKDDFQDKLLDCGDVYCIQDTDFGKWLLDSNNKPIETLVNMHQFGYEIEKEKLYTARLIFVAEEFNFVNKERSSDELFISNSETIEDSFRVYFTQTELEEMKIWGNPAFEIEEVEE